MNFCKSNIIEKVGLALVLLAVLVSPVYAATNALEPEPSAQQQNSPVGVSVGKTHGFITMRVGANFPNATGEQFGQITNQLTLEKKDFQAVAFGFDMGAAFKSHYALAFDWEYYQASPSSEFRHFVEENGNPITQTTKLRQMPFTATFRYYPWKMGEDVGSYVWIPSRFLPYIGGGGGFMYYKISQEGSFVNTNPLSPNYLDIVDGNPKSSGIIPTAHLAAGLDISINSRFYANFEARYVFAHAHLSQDFTTIREPLDLKGARVSGGIGVRF